MKKNTFIAVLIINLININAKVASYASIISIKQGSYGNYPGIERIHPINDLPKYIHIKFDDEILNHFPTGCICGRKSKSIENNEGNSFVFDFFLKLKKEMNKYINDRSFNVMKNGLGGYSVTVNYMIKDLEIKQCIDEVNNSFGLEISDTEKAKLLSAKKDLLFNALNQDKKKLIEMLIDAKICDINIKDNHGKTVLHYACDQGKTDIVKMLINLGANLNIQDNSGNTALHLTCTLHGKKDIAEILILAGIDMEIKNYHGETALYSACIFNKTDIIRLLIDSGANLDTKFNGKTIFDYICEKSNFELIELFLNYYKKQEDKQLTPDPTVKKSIVNIENRSDDNLNILQETNIPANSKAEITTKISDL